MDKTCVSEIGSFVWSLWQVNTENSYGQSMGEMYDHWSDKPKLYFYGYS